MPIPQPTNTTSGSAPAGPGRRPARWRIFLSASVGLLGLIAACTGGLDASLATEHAIIGTQVDNLRITNTVEVARMLITVDYANTQAALVATQSGFLKATLASRGTDIAYLNEAQATMMQGVFIAIVETPDDGPVVTLAAPTPTPPPTIDDGRPRLEDIRLTDGPGQDDCGNAPLTSFGTTSEAVYVTMRVRNAPANTRFTSRWYRETDEVARFDYVPDFAISEACIWFFLEQSDVLFTPGSWSVLLEINNQIASAPQSFTFVGTTTDGMNQGG